MATTKAPQFYHALQGLASKIPIPTTTPVLTLSPLTLSTPLRLVPLQLKLSAPVTGTSLPIILLSHGHGQSNNLSSLNGYGPLVNFWAAHGFAVIQPTHLSSKTLSFPAETDGAPLYWRERVEDMKTILDRQEEIEELAPMFKGRLDWTRVAVAGHSMGGQTASVLLGQQIEFPEGVVNMYEPRIKAGLLLTPPGDGNGGKDLSPFALNFSFFKYSNFSTMKTSTLVVVGDTDVSPHLTTRDEDWHADPYTLAPGPKSLLSICGGGHLLGGVSGYDANETTDESVERVGVVQRLSWAYLWSALNPGDGAWGKAKKALEGVSGLGSVEEKE